MTTPLKKGKTVLISAFSHKWIVCFQDNSDPKKCVQIGMGGKQGKEKNVWYGRKENSFRLKRKLNIYYSADKIPDTLISLKINQRINVIYSSLNWILMLVENPEFLLFIIIIGGFIFSLIGIQICIIVHSRASCSSSGKCAKWWQEPVSTVCFKCWERQS